MENLYREQPSICNARYNIRWRFVPVGGAKIDPRINTDKNLFNYIDQVAVHHPDIVYLHVGENDLRTLHHRVIVERIIYLAEKIAEACHPREIIISRLTVFPVNDDLADISKHINTRLERYFRVQSSQPQFTHISLWKHKMGIFGENRLRWYGPDDVHLNAEGQAKYTLSAGAAANYVWSHRH